MPELPEVEFCAQRLRSWLVGHTITSVEASDGLPLREITADRLRRDLEGSRVTSLRRHGKQLFIDLDSSRTLWVHLGMTGKWVRVQPEELRRWARITLILDDGTRLAFVDPRKFGRIYLRAAVSPDEELRQAGLGPDALDVCDTKGALSERLARTSRAIKIALMEQKLLAGVGNIYAAEALFDVGLDPRKPANSLSQDEYAALAIALAHAMRISLARETHPEITYLNEGKQANPFWVYGREGESCVRCNATVERFTQGGRSTFFCAGCQGKPG